jgi:uncharacterized membrane protein YwaF
MKEIFNNNTLAIMIFLCCVVFIGAVICIIRDNIVNDKKGLNPQIAMVVSLGILSIIIITFICRCIYLFSSYIITKILNEMIRGNMIWTIVGAVVIAVVMTFYWLLRIDDLSGDAPENADQTYESDKNDEIEPQEDHHELVEAAPEEHDVI